MAQLVESSMRKAVESGGGGARERWEVSIHSILESLVLSGIGITFAGCSHLVSGFDHYFAHSWEMMLLERGKDNELNYIQTSAGMLLTLKIIEYLKTIRPDMAHAEAAADRTGEAVWEKNLSRVLPKAADGIIEIKREVHKKDRTGRLQRAAMAIERWDEILTRFETMLPSCDEAEAMMHPWGCRPARMRSA